MTRATSETLAARNTRRNNKKGRKQANALTTIVGIGASAGGLDASERLLSCVRDDLGMAYILVQHLDPTHASHLTEILSRATRMPVSEVKEGMRVQADHVYIIPPNANMAMKHGILKLVPRQQVLHQHMPIDFFFRSLAEAQKHQAVGVILSGTASDGAAGMKAIKAAGGITFAQDARSAKYFGMPQSSIAAGVVDFVLPPEKIAAELQKIARHPYFHFARAKGTEEEVTKTDKETGLTELFAILKKSFGVDFSYYKQSTIQRRIRRRMALHTKASLKDYLHLVKTHPAELQALYRDMFVSVSGFFREANAFKRLQSTVMRKLLKNRPANSPVRIWVPGCSTGEEAYSIAIALLEVMGEKARSVQAQIFATDINEDAINAARKGRYLDDAMGEVDRKRLRRWFIKTQEGYQVTKTVRDLIVFAKQDVTKEPPFSHLDLISCRNLLIYLGPTLQRRLLPLFHYALKSTGYLFLGSAETVGPFANMFTMVDRKHRIYAKKSVLVRQRFEFAADRTIAPLGEPKAGETLERSKDSPEAIKERADNILINEYAPPSVLVNEDMEIIQFRGRSGLYLEPASGSASLNLLKMAREGLLLELRAAIHEARKKNRPVLRRNVRVSQNGGWKVVTLRVAPVKAHLSKGLHFLVMFQEDSPPQPPQSARPKPKRLTEAEEHSLSRVRELKQELGATKAYLESVIEKQEGTNEELRSLNEEIQSANEELQSTSEELETANEELQSANEELTTLNEELQNRNQELSVTFNDMTNIMNSVNLALVILDKDLRIRRFTPAAQALFDLIPSGHGWPLSDLRQKLPLADLGEKIRAVIDSGISQKEEVQDSEGLWYSLEIQPYTTAEKKHDGAVLALADISARVRQRVWESTLTKDH